MAQVITPSELAEMVDDIGAAALHLCSADDLLVTIQAGHKAQERLADLEARFREMLGIGQPDEWECKHGVRVSQPCSSTCRLNPTRHALGLIP